MTFNDLWRHHLTSEGQNLAKNCTVRGTIHFCLNFWRIPWLFFLRLFWKFWKFQFLPLGGVWTYLELCNFVVVLVVKFWIIQIGTETIHVKHHSCQSLETKFTVDLSTTSTIGAQCTIQRIDPWSLEISTNISMEGNCSRCDWDENCLWKFLKKMGYFYVLRRFWLKMARNLIRIFFEIESSNRKDEF